MNETLRDLARRARSQNPYSRHAESFLISQLIDAAEDGMTHYDLIIWADSGVQREAVKDIHGYCAKLNRDPVLKQLGVSFEVWEVPRPGPMGGGGWSDGVRSGGHDGLIKCSW